jgi:hypothetical protein
MTSLLSTVERKRLAQGFRPDSKIFFPLKERLAKDFPMLSFGGAPMCCRPLSSRTNNLLADVSNSQLSHRSACKRDAFAAICVQ